MLQLYVTSTEHVGFYFLYDPVKDDIYEGSFMSYQHNYNQCDLQMHALHQAFIYLANTKALSRQERPRTDILLHAPVKIHIENATARKQFKAPWKYDGLWKTIAQKRRQLKYFDIQNTYQVTDLPPQTQVIFNRHLNDIESYYQEQRHERLDDDFLSAALDKF